MGSEALKILKDALALSPDERAAIAYELLESLVADRDQGFDHASAAEIKRRAERFRAGESKGIPFEEVKTRVVERYGPK